MLKIAKQMDFNDHWTHWNNISMKIIQEENIQPVEHRIQQRYRLDSMCCLFFILGMFLCAYLFHHVIF